MTLSDAGAIPRRAFGATGLRVSEVGFGGWAIGGKAYGAVDRHEAQSALARAEELGCNFVDTAAVYGDSELVLGDFLQQRRDKWVLATKYSRQAAPTATAALEAQLKRLRTEAVDFYQLHFIPQREEHSIYEEMYRLKKAGKARFVGVSVYTTQNIDYVLDNTPIDGVQVPFSLLTPKPFLPRLERLKNSGIAIVVRSSLREGFLTGSYTRDTRFSDPDDFRSTWKPARIAKTVERAERFRFLEAEAGSMTGAAIRYPLSFPEVSTVIVGTATAAQAETNFGGAPGGRLSSESLARVRAVQKRIAVDSFGERTLAFLAAKLRPLLRR